VSCSRQQVECSEFGESGRRYEWYANMLTAAEEGDIRKKTSFCIFKTTQTSTTFHSTLSKHLKQTSDKIIWSDLFCLLLQTPVNSKQNFFQKYCDLPACLALMFLNRFYI